MTSLDDRADLAVRVVFATGRRDRAEERVKQLRAQLGDALDEYGRADRELYKLRRIIDGKPDGEHFHKVRS